MALDDYMELDEDVKSNKQNTTKKNDDKNKQSLLKHDNWVEGPNGKTKKLGPYGYESREEFENTIHGKLPIHDDDGNTRLESKFKFKLPLFPYIGGERIAYQGNRYIVDRSQAVITCMEHSIEKLDNIPREMIMLDTGQPEKDKCLNTLSKRLDMDVTMDTTVHYYIFGHTRKLVKMAIADMNTESWSTKSIRSISKAIVDEAALLKYSEKEKGVDGYIRSDSITPW